MDTWPSRRPDRRVGGRRLPGRRARRVRWRGRGGGYVALRARRAARLRLPVRRWRRRGGVTLVPLDGDRRRGAAGAPARQRPPRGAGGTASGGTGSDRQGPAGAGDSPDPSTADPSADGAKSRRTATGSPSANPAPTPLRALRRPSAPRPSSWGEPVRKATDRALVREREPRLPQLRWNRGAFGHGDLRDARHRRARHRLGDGRVGREASRAGRCRGAEGEDLDGVRRRVAGAARACTSRRGTSPSSGSSGSSGAVVTAARARRRRHDRDRDHDADDQADTGACRGGAPAAARPCGASSTNARNIWVLPAGSWLPWGPWGFAIAPRP